MTLDWKSQPSDAHSGQLIASFWTLPFWVICTPAFDHKIGNGAVCGSSVALFFTKHHNWTKQRRKKWTTERLRRDKISNDAPIHDAWRTKRPTAEIITPLCGLTMFWLFSVISCSHSYAKKLLYVWGIKHVYIYNIIFSRILVVCHSRTA